MKCLGSRCQFQNGMATFAEPEPNFSLDNNPMEMISQEVTYPASFGFKQNNTTNNKLRGISS